MPSCRMRAGGSTRQTSPRACVTRKLIVAGVTRAAAQASTASGGSAALSRTSTQPPPRICSKHPAMLSGAIAATLPRGSCRGKGGPISRSPRPLPGPGVVGLPSRGRIPPGLALSEQAVEQRLRAPSHELARGPSERLAGERLACDLLDATLTVPTRADPTALLDDPLEHRVAPTPRSSATT